MNEGGRVMAGSFKHWPHTCTAHQRTAGSSVLDAEVMSDVPFWQNHSPIRTQGWSPQQPGTSTGKLYEQKNFLIHKTGRMFAFAYSRTACQRRLYRLPL